MNEAEAGILQPTIEDLKRIKLERENAWKLKRDEEERVRLALELSICPVCSGKIIEESEEKLEIPVRKWIFFKTDRKVWYTRKICSADKSHYENKLTRRQWNRENRYSGY